MRIVGARTRKGGTVDQLGKGWFVHGGRTRGGWTKRMRGKARKGRSGFFIIKRQTPGKAATAFLKADRAKKERIGAERTRAKGGSGNKG